MGIVLVGIWLIIFGIMGLVSTKVPDWIVPVAACIVGLIVLAGGGWWKRSPPMTRPLLALLFLVSLVGCVTGQPSAFERQAYYITTNWVPEVRGHIMLSNSVITGTNYVTQMVAYPQYEPKESVVTGIQTAGTIGTMLGFGPSGIIASIVVSLLGAWGHWRSSRRGKALTVFGQNIETAIETFKSMGPGGDVLASKFKHEIKAQQVEAGVKDMATVVAEEQVNTVKAEEAATRVNKGIAVNGPP